MTVIRCKKPYRRCAAAVLAAALTLGAAVFPARAERLAVTAPLANIRGGAGTDHEILWQAERYFPLETIRRTGPWIFFQDFEGDRGWIHRSLVGDIPCVITSAPVCNVRSGPGTQYDIRLRVEAGVPFRVLKQTGNWLHVEHADGERGWIHKSLVW